MYLNKIYQLCISLFSVLLFIMKINDVYHITFKTFLFNDSLKKLSKKKRIIVNDKY